MHKRNGSIGGQVRFNIFSFISTFARSLIETFLALLLYKNGFPLQQIVLFYILTNAFSFPISYFYVRLGNRTRYTAVLAASAAAFILMQFLILNLQHATWHLVLLAFTFALYRRGYWVARRYYITKVMPKKKSSAPMSIVTVFSIAASVAAGYAGSYFLGNVQIRLLTMISSGLLAVSMTPLLGVRQEKEKEQIRLVRNLRKTDKNDLLLFSLYEIRDAITFLFPIYVAVYIDGSYTMAGNINALKNAAIAVFVLIYGRAINKDKNYIVTSTLLMLLMTFFKISITNYFILAVFFVEGMIMNMQTQSVNKVYFEDRGKIDEANYNLIYQLTESAARSAAALPLLFADDVRTMIMMLAATIFTLLLIYIFRTRRKMY